MEFSKGELKVLLAAAVMGGGISGCVAGKLFHREKEFAAVRDGLVRHGFAEWLEVEGVLRVRRDRIAQELGLNAPSQPALHWPQEDELKRALCDGADVDDEAARGAPRCGNGDGAETAQVRGIRTRCAESARTVTPHTNVERSTFNRSNVETIKRSEGSAGASPHHREEVARVKARVRGSVGEADFCEYWQTGNMDKIWWSEPERVESIERSLNYLLAGVRTGEVVIRTTFGRALWSQVKWDWRDRMMSEAVGK